VGTSQGWSRTTVGGEGGRAVASGPDEAATSGETTPSRRRRWPYLGPGQSRLLLAAAAILIGSFLPWVDTAFGAFSGMAGPGVWTFYAGVIALAGAMIRRRGLALAHAWVAGVICVALPLWQAGRLLQICGGGACAPASGLVLVLGAGVYACLQARRMGQPVARTG
jgi:hypothetical protein